MEMVIVLGFEFGFNMTSRATVWCS